MNNIIPAIIWLIIIFGLIMIPIIGLCQYVNDPSKGKTKWSKAEIDAWKRERSRSMKMFDID